MRGISVVYEHMIHALASRAALAVALLVVLLIGGQALAGLPAEVSTAPSPKTPRPWPASDPVGRQGGDTIATAVVIPSLPFADTGTTTGFTDDLDQACPYVGSVAPDVVYSYTPTVTEWVTLDLCGSSYDTKLYVLDSDLAVVVCNDDAYVGAPCGRYVSACAGVLLAAGEPYFVVVDGYGAEHGDYALTITVDEPCTVAPSGWYFLENEPPLSDGYVDLHNGGCGSPNLAFSDLIQGPEWSELGMVGTSGWYLRDGASHRDTDWIEAAFGSMGYLEATIVVEQPMYLMHLGPTDCNDVQVLQTILAEPCEPITLRVEGDPYEITWLWVGPVSLVPPSGYDGHEFAYSLHLSGFELDHLTLAGADRAPGCPPLPLSCVEATFGLGGMHDDYHAPAECLDNPTTGPDAIYSVWMQAGEQLQFENDYSIYPRSESRPTVQDSVACYLLDDLRGGAGSCVDAFGTIGHMYYTFTAEATGFHHLVIDFTGGSPDYTTRMYIWNEASPPPPAPAHDTCGGAIELPSVGPFSVADQLTTARNDYDLDGEQAGTTGDVVYRMELAAGSHLEATMTGSGWDEALYLADDRLDPSGSCLAIAAPAGPDGVHLVYTAVEAGEYWLICDSYGMGPRPFTLTGSVTSTVAVADGPPSAPTLHPAAPNPFNPRTTLSFSLPRAQECRLSIYALDGRLVTTLVDAVLGAGRHQVTWDGTDARGRPLPSGSYICRLKTELVTTSQALVLVR